MTTVNIFFTGATGFIGGTVLDRFLKHPQASNFHITALVRSEAGAKALKSLGVDTVTGSYADLAILEEQASKADYVVALADSDDVPANAAILRGLKARFEKTGKAPVLVHASGIAFISDDALGSHLSERVWNDNEVDAINAIPIEKFHRQVDIPIIQAATEGYVKSFIVVPGIVYGTPSGKLVDLGAQKTVTGVVKLVVQFAIANGGAIIPGEGKNKWAYVHVNDCADLIYVVFSNAIEGKDVGNGREGIYFAEAGEHTTTELVTPIVAALYKAGKLPTATAASATGELSQSFFIKLLGGNARCRGDRSRAAGWKPVVPDAEFLTHLNKDIDAALAALDSEKKIVTGGKFDH